MNRTVFTMEQRSADWYDARLGRLTGSRAAAMLSEIKSGESAKRRDLRYDLVCERLTGRSQDNGYVNADMQWGIDHEAEAVAAYEAATGQIAMPVGFVSLTDLMAGCSPDGVIGDFEGLVSIKCPKTATHVRYLRENRIPPDYLPQIVCELWVTGAQWCDFVSFDPRLPDHLQTFLIRYERDLAAVSAFAMKATQFLQEVDEEEAALKGWRVLKEAV